MRAVAPVFTTQDSIADPEFARIAHGNLQKRLGRLSWYKGSAVISDGAGGYAIEVRVSDWGAAAAVPRIWLGVPVVVKLGARSARALSGAPLTTQDYANVALGGIVMVGTFIVGRIAVDSVFEARREHFDAKGQPPAAVQAKETTLDGILKMAVMAFSMYQLQKQLPELAKEAQKLLE